MTVYLPPPPTPPSSPALFSFETNNQYEIKNSLGQKIYKAKEKNNCCTRNCCGALRSFDMKNKDNNDQEVIRLIRLIRPSTASPAGAPAACKRFESLLVKGSPIQSRTCTASREMLT